MYFKIEHSCLLATFHRYMFSQLKKDRNFMEILQWIKSITLLYIASLSLFVVLKSIVLKLLLISKFDIL